MQLPMQTHFVSLADEILKLPPCIICLTGGGGKSSLMYSLGAAISRLGNSGRGARVLLTTTTRIMRPNPLQSAFFVESDTPASLSLPEMPCVLTAAAPAGLGQNPDYLCGYNPQELDNLWKRSAADWIIVEADGSARRPIKAPVDKEPVIPSLCGLVIAVAGLSAVGEVYDDKRVFRAGAFSELTGLRPGDRLAPETLAALFTHPAGLFKGSPEKARRMAFLNQADATGKLEQAVALAQAVLSKHDGMLYGVYAGSARQRDVPCLRFVPITPIHHFFNSEVLPELQEYSIKDHFFAEGLSLCTGRLWRVELEGKKLYACLDFFEKGQLNIDVMEKLGQGPLMQSLTAPGAEKKQKDALLRMRELLSSWARKVPV